MLSQEINEFLEKNVARLRDSDFLSTYETEILTLFSHGADELLIAEFLKENRSNDHAIETANADFLSLSIKRFLIKNRLGKNANASLKKSYFDAHIKTIALMLKMGYPVSSIARYIVEIDDEVSDKKYASVAANLRYYIERHEDEINTFDFDEVTTPKPIKTKVKNKQKTVIKKPKQAKAEMKKKADIPEFMRRDMEEIAQNSEELDKKTMPTFQNYTPGEP